MGLLRVLNHYGLDLTSQVKLARHLDHRWDMEESVGTKVFEDYQSWQRYAVFHNLDYVVSFIGDGPNRARFWGVYRVLGYGQFPYRRLPKRVPWPWHSPNPHYRYDLKKLAGFEPLVAQLVIEWRNGRAWHQYLKDYAVIESPVLNDWNQVTPASRFVEGQPYTKFVSGRRRNREAREMCLRFHKAVCSVCGMSFPMVYGGLGRGFMHVHHRDAMADLVDIRTVNPKRDLIPVCPNCRAILHLEAPLGVEELREIVRNSRRRK